MDSIPKSRKEKRAEENKRNFERNQNNIKNNGLIFVKKYHNKALYKCLKCGNTMLIKPRLLNKNPICRNCMSGASFGEEATIKILNSFNISYTKEKTFKGLKGENNKPLRFDFYIYSNNNGFIIEIDGQQHKEGNEWGGNTSKHDTYKNSYCRDNNIKLYRVPYKTGKLQTLESKVLSILRAEGLITEEEQTNER